MTERRQPSRASGSAPLDHITNPVLNLPHEEPSRHWRLGEDNTSTGEIEQGRRPSQSLTVVPKVRKQQFQLKVTEPLGKSADEVECQA